MPAVASSELLVFGKKIALYVLFVGVYYGCVRVLQRISPTWSTNLPLSKIIRTCVVDRRDQMLSSPSMTKGLKNDFSSPSMRALALGGCAIGLNVAYLSWGVLQERIMTRDYGGEQFHSSQFLVFGNRFCALIIAIIVIQCFKQPPFYAPLYLICFSSFSNVMSSFCQYEALKFVTFPTQVIFKSSKLIPVMIMGKLLSNKQYPPSEYLMAIMISFGVAVFTLSSKEGSGGGEETTSSGLIYLFGYIAFDSFTSQWQGKLFSSFKISSYHMMAGINMFSAFFTLMSLYLSGELMYSVDFATRNPTFLMHMALLSMAGTLGQLLIFFTIKTFGPLVFTIIMATRQLLSTILSSIVYGHHITAMGFVGAAVVFATIGVRIYFKIMKGKSSKNDNKVSKQLQNVVVNGSK